ncbi:amino acid adenylation domain-containing protein [Nocardia sp. NBC_00416]|nr:non-ribosomal peptide synthetase [Nocardia sp. NBC_00416]
MTRPTRTRPTRTRGPRLTTLPQLMATAVESNPSGTAVVHADAAATLATLTYAELDARSNRLARLLIARGIGPEDLVAIGIPRSLDSVVAVWAVAKTGAGYVPVDPRYPADRVRHMVTDSGAVFGLSVAESGDELPDRVQWLRIDSAEAAQRLADESADPVTFADRVRPLRAEHPAYVIYTSGSTGLPKGVVVTQAGLAGFCAEQRDRYRVDTTSRTLHFASPSFDASVLELLLALGGAATMVVAAPTVYGGDELAGLLKRERVTHAFITPAALASLDPAGLDEFRVVVAGGEACPPDLVRRWAGLLGDGRPREFFNGYGPTETTIMTNISDPLVPGATVTIGAPTRGITEYVLDERLAQVPTGVTGELYITGAQQARGYHARPGLTAARFVANPFGDGAARLYRTGDLVRWLSDGTLEYLGRNDFQVKIRGFRIELGEIDAVLAEHASVDFAVTVGHELDSGATILAAYVHPVAGARIDIDELSALAASRLPAHMVPAGITVLDEIPLTPVGKLDRRALPAPQLRTRTFRAPETELEQQVAAVFADLLNPADPVGADDDFFDLGGNSLIATQVAGRLGAVVDARVPARAIFEASTVSALAVRLDELRGSGRPLLSRQTRPERIPLSPAQQRMWFLNRFDTESAAYNVPVAVRLSGRLDISALRGAIADLVERHEVLRTVYPETDAGPEQVVLDPARAIPGLAVHTVTESGIPAAMLDLMSTLFDITTEVPLRVALLLVEGAADEYVLALVVHHIAADGSSFGPLTRDLMVAYAARSGGAAPQWAPLPVQYADYSIWQRGLLGSESDPESLGAQQIAYWRSTLAGLPDQLELPLDRPRPAVQSFAGGRVQFRIDADLHRALLDLAQGPNATLFMVMQSAFAVLLAQLSGTDDISVGVPLAGRGEAALDDLIGMFVNTLVFRTRVDRGESFRDLLARQKEDDLQAFANADVPFERLVEIQNPVRSTARHPLFQVCLSFQNLAPTTLELPGLTVAEVDFDTERSQFDLHLTLADMYDETGAAGGLAGDLAYAKDLFEHATAQGFVDRLLMLLRAVAADPGTPVGDLDILAVAERESIVAGRNDTARATDPSATLATLLADAVAGRSDAVALIAADGTRVSYAELDARVNRLARHLIGLGVGPDSRVVLALRRSVDLVVAMYAVTVAGGTYVPIDPDQPAERNGFILSAAAPVCVLTDGAPVPVAAGVPVLRPAELDLSALSADPVADADRIAALRPEHLAYVLFTSGSTGRPKGVAVPHAAVVNQLRYMVDEFGMKPTDSVLLKTAATFDMSVWEFWSAVGCGGAMVIAAPDGHRDPAYLNELIRRESPTTLHVVPSMLDALLADGLPDSLQRVFAIGEALPGSTAQRLLADCPRTDLFNMYGPTEAAVSITTHRVTPADSASVPVGVPQWNSRVYVLDARLHPVPDGVAGELYLAGDQLARGYHSRPDLTADRFVADPFRPGERMYRTGDLAAWQTVRDAQGRPSAVLDYRGRTDFQVKLRGFRIELGEIEAALLALPVVDQAVVVARSHPRLGDSLVAYVTGAAAIDVEQVRSELAQALPSYMVPAAFVVLDRLPLNVNGKIDRRALPEPEFTAPEFRPPVTPHEHAVATAFAEVLGTENVGLDADFFALGGNSLSATQVVSRLAKLTGTRIQVAALFGSPAVQGLARHLAAVAERGGDDQGTHAATAVMLPIRPGSGRRPLFCFHPMSGMAWGFAGLARYLPAEQPILGLQTPALTEADYAPGSLDELAERYLREIRAVQPVGPYRFLGWSLGGTVAQAVAVRLQSEGERIELLGVMDAYPDTDVRRFRAEIREAFAALGIPDAAVPDADSLWAIDDVVLDTLHAAIPPQLSDVLTRDRLRRLIDTAVRSVEFAGAHRPPVFRGQLQLFRALDNPEAGSAQDWEPYVSGVVVDHPVPATHDGMTTPAALAVIGPWLAARLGDAPGDR